MLSIGIGHQLDTVTHILGDLATVNATATIAYPVSILVDQDNKPTGETLNATSPDHFAITGLHKSGIISSFTWRSGYPVTKGRRQFLWEIDGDEGSIKVESDGVYGALLNLAEPELYLNGELIAKEGDTGNAVNLTNAWVQIAKGEKGEYATIDDAVKNRALVDAIERSIEEQKTIIL